MLAVLLDRQATCVCGTRLDEWGHIDEQGVLHKHRQPPYVAQLERCPGCAAKQAKQAKQAKTKPDDYGLYVTLVPPRR